VNPRRFNRTRSCTSRLARSDALLTGDRLAGRVEPSRAVTSTDECPKLARAEWPLWAIKMSKQTSAPRYSVQITDWGRPHSPSRFTQMAGQVAAGWLACSEPKFDPAKAKLVECLLRRLALRPCTAS
jgi:hypothetical protein